MQYSLWSSNLLLEIYTKFILKSYIYQNKAEHVMCWIISKEIIKDNEQHFIHNIIRLHNDCSL
jgi:hypothetical protein